MTPVTFLFGLSGNARQRRRRVRALKRLSLVVRLARGAGQVRVDVPWGGYLTRPNLLALERKP